MCSDVDPRVNGREAAAGERLCPSVSGGPFGIVSRRDVLANGAGAPPASQILFSRYTRAHKPLVPQPTIPGQREPQILRTFGFCIPRQAPEGAWALSTGKVG